MQDYIVTFAAKTYGTSSYIMTGFASKAQAVAEATYMARIEMGSIGFRLKEARLYNGKGYVCKG